MRLDKHEYALMESHCISAEEEHFKARPQFDNAERRNYFQAGFRAAWKIRMEKERQDAIRKA